jgi:hypothetical protein
MIEIAMPACRLPSPKRLPAKQGFGRWGYAQAGNALRRAGTSLCSSNDRLTIDIYGYAGYNGYIDSKR